MLHSDTALPLRLSTTVGLAIPSCLQPRLRGKSVRGICCVWAVVNNSSRPGGRGRPPLRVLLPSPAHPILRDFHHYARIVQLSADGIRPLEIPSAARGFDLRDFFLNLFIGNALCAK